MRRNYIIGFLAAAILVGLLTFVAWSVLEVYPITKRSPPSRAARINEYLALDRWLESMDIPVRTESSGNLFMILNAEENHIFIQSSLFSWSAEAVEYLIAWVEKGGRLFLAFDLDHSREWDEEEPLQLLEKFGIELRTEDISMGYHYDSQSPDYDHRVFFELSGTGDALVLKDWSNTVRLVQVKRGKGSLAITGRPLFLLSENLDKAPNARLAWALFASEETGSQKTGCLFIRGTTKIRGLLGELFRQGNLPVLAVSVLVLLAVCFWSVIPVFGLVRADEERPGKPLRERFLAEGRFLKRYGALAVYRDRYIREIKRRLVRREGLCTDDEISRRILDLWRKAPSAGSRMDRRFSDALLAKVLQGEVVHPREFPGLIVILMSILERI